MQMQTEDSARLAQLAAKLAQARAKASEAEADLKKAQRRVERADDVASALRAEYDQERLRLWGSKPDVAELLNSEGSMVFYYAGEALAEAYGLGWGMKWGDTNQTVLHVRLNRGEIGAIERAKSAVLFFAPYIKAKRGWTRFGVQHRESSDFALELRYSTKTGAAKIGRLHFGQEEGAYSFVSLEAALLHIQEHHWIEDIIDIPSGQALLA